MIIQVAFENKAALRKIPRKLCVLAIETRENTGKF